MHIFIHLWLQNYANTAEISSINEEYAGIVNHAASENKESKRLQRSRKEMISVMRRFMIYLKRQNIYKA